MIKQRNTLSSYDDGHELRTLLDRIIKNRNITDSNIRMLVSNFIESQLGDDADPSTIRCSTANLYASMTNKTLTWKRFLKLLRALTAMSMTVELVSYRDDDSCKEHRSSMVIDLINCDKEDGKLLSELFLTLGSSMGIRIPEMSKLISEYLWRTITTPTEERVRSGVSNLLTDYNRTTFSWKRLMIFLRVALIYESKLDISITFRDGSSARAAVIIKTLVPINCIGRRNK